MPEFQHVRLSLHHPRVHLASPAITEENKTEDRCTYCGIALRVDSLLRVKEPVSCGLCLRKLVARRR